ncbi:MAG TPA: hypothetical protein PKH33_17435 [bacterium]|nr:hypothetical protein [bacterium]
MTMLLILQHAIFSEIAFAENIPQPDLMTYFVVPQELYDDVPWLTSNDLNRIYNENAFPSLGDFMDRPKAPRSPLPLVFRCQGDLGNDEWSPIYGVARGEKRVQASQRSALPVPPFSRLCIGNDEYIYKNRRHSAMPPYTIKQTP